MHPTNFEMVIFEAINGYAGISWILDGLMRMLANNNLVKNGLFIASFWVLWVKATPDQTRRRADLCFIMFIAVPLSLIINQAISFIFPFRPRPIYWIDIGFRQPTIDLSKYQIAFDNSTSFPSDHAAMFFALTTGFWFISRRLAVLMALWSIVCSVARIFVGLHFPADIFIGAAVAIAVTAAVHREVLLHYLAKGVNHLQARIPALFHTSVGLFVFQIGNLFWELRHLSGAALKAVQQLFH